MNISVQREINGFTIVEMMVAMAVLAISVLILTNVIDSSINTILRSKGDLNIDNRARIIFDTIQRDIDGISNRSDVDVILFKNDSTSINDSLFAFSRSNGYFDGSTFSSVQKNSVCLVGYRVNCQSQNNNGVLYYSNSSYGQLERLGKSLAWEQASNGNQMPFIGYNPVTTSWAAVSATTIAGFGFKSKDGNESIGTLPEQFTDGLDSDYQVVGSSVFRFELSYLLTDGTQSNIPIENPNYGGTVVMDNLTETRAPMTSDDASASFGTGSRWYDTTHQIGYICTSAVVGQAYWTQLGVQDVKAIVVTMVLLPQNPIPNPGNVQTAVIAKAPNVDLNVLAMSFPKAGASVHNANTDVAGNLITSWESVVDGASGNSPITGLPKSIAGGMYVYQRYLFLP